MQSARIWYNAEQHHLSLAELKVFLIQDLGCQVMDWEWRLETISVPQLRVTWPARFLLQIDTHPDVAVEADEFVGILAAKLPKGADVQLHAATARIEAGDDDGTDLAVAGRMAEWSELDPADPNIHRILLSIARKLGGLFEDNINGRVMV
jgi:hypothetical protein